MHRLFPTIWLLTLVVSITCTHGQLTSKAPAPDWISPVSLPEHDGIDNYGNAGTAYLLYERQDHPAQQTFFGRRAFRFLTVAGVEDSSTLTWTLDPDYERLVMHTLLIHRDGVTIDLLPTIEFRISSSYQDDKAQSYDNAKEARILLEDARVGDVLEYSYSVIGSNPVTDDHFSSSFLLSWSVPVERVYYRLLWDDSKELQWQAYNQAESPVISKSGPLIEYLWQRESVPAVQWEDDMPPEVYAQDWVQLSDWNSWEAVSTWGASLYPLDAELPPPLETVLQEIKQTKDPAKQIVQAVRYVQDEFRYVSVVFGPHNYEPFPLDLIVERRYGDCKDKALLLCILLRELGFEAQPVLVDLDDRASIADMLPSPKVFDHVITRLEFAGKVYWLDPTVTLQGGDLSSIYLPPVGAGLVLVNTGGSIEKNVGHHQDPESYTHIEESFDLPAWTGKSSLNVRTTMRGNHADRMRRELAKTSLSDLERNYREYYNHSYGALQNEKRLKISDDREANIIKIAERYRVEELFKPDPDRGDGYVTCYFECDYIDDYLPDTAVGVERIQPLYIAPQHVRQTLKINLPDDSKFDAEEVSIRNDWFEFDYSVSQKKRILTIDTVYRSERDAVPAAEYQKLAADVSKVKDLLSYGIYANTESEISNQRVTSILKFMIIGLGAFLILGILVAGIVVAILVRSKHKPPPLPPAESGR